MNGYVGKHELCRVGVSYGGWRRVGVMWVRGRCECDREKCESEDGTCDWEGACEKGVRCVVW